MINLITIIAFLTCYRLAYDSVKQLKDNFIFQLFLYLL